MYKRPKMHTEEQLTLSKCVELQRHSTKINIRPSERAFNSLSDLFFAYPSLFPPQQRAVYTYL